MATHIRLLKLTGSDTYAFESFPKGNEPPYAILSHTWGSGPTYEVLYDDIGSNSGVNKPGFKKLQFCGRQAQADGLSYFWIDTCCIDKRNLVELQAAINSMFRWYKAAARCYAYLTDVSLRSADGLQEHRDWEGSFRNSRWFTRGWTLQELIAPPIVEFFSQDGVRLGDKRSLKEIVEATTGISSKILEGAALDTCSVEERQSWVKSRRTSEEEDMAYCLLGIFEVSMIINYGEGKTSANRRLLAQIREQRFGRPTELERLDEELNAIPVTRRNIIRSERRYNRLRLSEETETAVVSVPRFQAECFKRFTAAKPARSFSSTFQLADLLDMLPGQANHYEEDFNDRELWTLHSSLSTYETPCSRSAIAGFICEHFHSFRPGGNNCKILTNVGTFEIISEEFATVVRLNLRESSTEAHPLVSTDSDSVLKFAAGKFRHSEENMQVLGPGRAQGDRWYVIAIKKAIQTGGFDHPACIRFASQEQHDFLESSLQVCRTLIATFNRIVGEFYPDGVPTIENWEMITKIMTMFKDCNFAHPSSVQMVTGAQHSICTMAVPDQTERLPVLQAVLDVLEQCLDNSDNIDVIAGRMEAYHTQGSVPHMACLAAMALLTGMNCSILLTFTVVCPLSWLEFLQGATAEVMIE